MWANLVDDAEGLEAVYKLQREVLTRMRLVEADEVQNNSLHRGLWGRAASFVIPVL